MCWPKRESAEEKLNLQDIALLIIFEYICSGLEVHRMGARWTSKLFFLVFKRCWLERKSTNRYHVMGCYGNVGWNIFKANYMDASPFFHFLK